MPRSTVHCVALTVGVVLVVGAGRLACAQPLDLRTARVVDLTHPFDEKTLYWPNVPSGFELKRLHFGPSDGGYFYSANSFCAPEHGGTHLDAPIHFAEGQATVGQLPVEKLIGPAVVIDVTRQAASDPDYRLSLEDVRAWERRLGAIPSGALVLLRTGWSARWPDKKRYFGSEAPGDATQLHFPSYGVEAARLLVETRKVAALGIDTASIDYGPSKDFAVHRVAMGAGVPGLENLDHLDALPEKGAWIVALPMKIGEGSGAPLRAVAFLPR
jgi:kynurenine formamidase